MSPDLHTLVGAYALDALDPQERAEFDQHLASCDTCRTELAELVETAARMGSATETTPPPAMRARVLDAVARIPQERPNVVSLDARRSRPWTTRGLAVAAALLAVLGVGVGVSQLSENRNLREEQIALTDVLSADDKVAYDTHGKGPHLSVVMSPEMDAAVVSMRDLPALDGGRSYQVWRKTADGLESAAVLDSEDVDRNRATTLVQGLGGTEAVAVTEEPAGGSPQPTTEPLVTLDMT